jgi:hypothetical protein
VSDKPLRKVSPCEHGHTHEIEALQEGCDFAVAACRDSKRRTRVHHVTARTYPVVVRRKP